MPKPSTLMTTGLPPAGPQHLLKSPSTRIPKKLAPLKRHQSECSAVFAKRSEFSLSRGWKSGDSEAESLSPRSSISSDRISRDYTNLKCQDPEFYESPKIIGVGELNEQKYKIFYSIFPW